MNGVRTAPAAVAGAVAVLVPVLAACGGDESPTVWSRDGEPVAREVAESYRGAEHCGWTGVTILRVAWPLGTAGTSGRARTYVRDPEQELADQTVTDFEPAAELPSGAAFTGYSSDDGELWLDPARQDQVAYVVSEEGSHVEAWPRTETLIGCD